MKMTTPAILLAALLISSFSVAKCQQLGAPKSLTKPLSKRMKKVEVSIIATRRKAGFSACSSFVVGPKSQPTVTVYWNGYGFIGKDSGRTLWQNSDDLAFQNRQTAQFTIKKKVTISDKTGSVATSTSNTVTVKRGVPATF